MEKTMESGRNAIVITVSVIAVTSFILLIYLHGEDLVRSESSRSKSDSEQHQKILIILTQTRSGSSFTGEIFAASNNGLYFYEPLYPFGLKCDYQAGKEALLKQLLSCDFSKLQNIYSYGFKKSGYNDGGDCRKNGICFTAASTGLLKRYAKICSNKSQMFQPESKTCGYPIQPKILAKLCKSTNLIITKITRMCTLDELEKVYRHLVAGERQVYVLHLVRDLRSIASSIIKLNKNKWSPTGVVKGIKNRFGSRQRHNLGYCEADFAESNIIADGRYMRVRYEDFVKNPVGKAEEVFRFMGLFLPPEVVANIHNYLHPDKAILQQIAKNKVTRETEAISSQYRSPFGVVRDPTKIQDEWREIVPFDVVKQIQEEFGDVLKKNGYVLFSSEKTMKDRSIPSFQDIDPTY